MELEMVRGCVCDSLTKAMVLSAFSCIEQDFRRNNNKDYEYVKTNPR